MTAQLGGGYIDILVNNAGIYPFGPTADASQDDFDAVYNINVKAPFFLVSALAPQMAERGTPPPRRTAAPGCPRRSRPR
jgi:NAD(P)-dependent dehydrogenase (short-subunit alcohol dehydrogenase family)